MPDEVPLSSLLLPGRSHCLLSINSFGSNCFEEPTIRMSIPSCERHSIFTASINSMALYGCPFSQCQATALAVQLQSGIRALDIRLAVVKSRLIAYHGSYPERTPFQEVLSTIHAFLTASTTSRETVVMSIKQEDFAKTPPETFSKLVHQEIFSGPGGREMWFFENRIPNLGEVRGKVVLLSRFGGNGDGWDGGLEGLGIHPTTWPDSQKGEFSWQCKDTLVRTQDW